MTCTDSILQGAGKGARERGQVSFLKKRPAPFVPADAVTSVAGFFFLLRWGLLTRIGCGRPGRRGTVQTVPLFALPETCRLLARQVQSAKP